MSSPVSVLQDTTVITALKVRTTFLIYHYVTIVCEKSYLDFNFTSIDLKLNKFDINYSIIRPFAKGQTKCREKLPRCHITKTYGINNFELLNMFAKHTVAPTKYRATQVL